MTLFLAFLRKLNRVSIKNYTIVTLTKLQVGKISNPNANKSLQSLRSSDRCSAPTTSAANRPMKTRKSADANDLGVDDGKQVRLRAYPVRMCGTKKRYLNAAWHQRLDWLKYSI